MLKNKIDSSKIKILVCCHKKCELPPNQDEIFLPIQVGAAINENHWGIQRDDQVNDCECDNISAKNKSYCELTAMYWAWKNIKKIYPDIEYIGLNHYRRFFSSSEKNLFSDIITKKEENVINYKLNISTISKYLTKDKVLIAKQKILPYPLDIDYSTGHFSDDIKILRKVIHDLSPDYDQSFYKVIMCNNKISSYNIFLMKYEYFDEYCSWLFSVLQECEKRININNYNSFQYRIWGYMAERLFNVWLNKNIKNIKSLNIVFFSDNPKENELKMIFKDIRNSLSAKLLNRSQKQNFHLTEDEEKYIKLISQ